MTGRHNPSEDYACPKCRGRRALTRQAAVGKSGLADILQLKAGKRYLLVTCALCGYTELYDLALVAAKPAAVPHKSVAPADARPEALRKIVN